MDINITQEKLSIGQLYNEYKQGDIILSPEYQRDFVWSQKMKDKLVESFILGIPIHDIVFAQFSNREKGYRDVLDGKHRLKALFEHLDNMQKQGRGFVDFKRKGLAITEVIDPTEAQVLEIYNRLNYGGVAHK